MKFFLFAAVCCIASTCFAQDISGKWVSVGTRIFANAGTERISTYTISIPKKNNRLNGLMKTKLSATISAKLNKYNRETRPLVFWNDGFWSRDLSGRIDLAAHSLTIHAENVGRPPSADDVVGQMQYKIYENAYQWTYISDSANEYLVCIAPALDKQNNLMLLDSIIVFSREKKQDKVPALTQSAAKNKIDNNSVNQLVYDLIAAEQQPKTAKEDTIFINRFQYTEIRQPATGNGLTTTEQTITGSETVDDSVKITHTQTTRNNRIFKEIIADTDLIKIDLYDVGEIDGDSVSLFLNGKLVAMHQLLKASATSFTIKLDRNLTENKLVLFAENLGSIPPNTSYMVITVNNKEYALDMQSDERTNGEIVFRFVVK